MVDIASLGWAKVVPDLIPHGGDSTNYSPVPSRITRRMFSPKIFITSPSAYPRFSSTAAGVGSCEISPTPFGGLKIPSKSLPIPTLIYVYTIQRARNVIRDILSRNRYFYVVAPTFPTSSIAYSSNAFPVSSGAFVSL